MYPAHATSCTTTGNNITLSTCTFDSGTYTFTGTLTIPNGVTVTMIGTVELDSDSIDVEGTIDGTGGGLAAPTGTGGSANPGGAGYGGNGAQGGGITYGSVKTPTDLGSGAGNAGFGGGAGGAAIKLHIGGSGSITVNGTVRSNGGNGTGGNSSGSGGSVWIDAPSGTLAGTTGLVTANGGAGSFGGSAGGGRIAVYYTTNTSSLVSGNKINAYGGNNGTGNIGGAGTIYLKSAAATNGDLLVDNNTLVGANTTQAESSLTFDTVTVRNLASYVIPSTDTMSIATGTSGNTTNRGSITVNNGGTLDVPTAAFTFDKVDVNHFGAVNVAGGTNLTDLSLTNSTYVYDTATASFDSGNLTTLTAGSGGTFSEKGAGTITIGTVTVQSGGNVTHEVNSTTQANILSLSATTFDVQSGGTVSVNSKGFQGGSGTGGTTNSGGGAAYGGNGGAGTGSGVTYGSVTAPTDLGSGGGNVAQNNYGGGALKLSVSGTLTDDGTISANGGSGTGLNVSGSGGSVWLNNIGTLAGSGTITANGGAGSGGGGGGRISIVYTTDSSTTTRQAFGGVDSGANGGAGTIYLFHTGVATHGDLIVNNNNSTPGSYGKTTQVTTASQTYDNVTIDNGASYVVPNGFTLSVAASGGFTTGGTTRPSLTMNSGGTFTPPTSTFIFTNIDVTNNGTVALVTNATVGPSSTFVENSVTGSFSATLSTLTVGASGSGIFSQSGTGTISIPSVTVQSGGSVTHEVNTTTQANILSLIATTFDVQSGGTVSVDAKGFQAQSGTGGTTNSGGGAAYGGNGGGNSGSGVTYGSVTAPTDLGSGGGNIGQNNNGGGAIKLVVSGTLTVDGSITATGGSGTGGNASGSGGSVWLNNIGTLAGSGTISANGGVGSAGGGGGRISIVYTTDSSTTTRQAFGGADAGAIGGAGTIYLFHTGVSTNGNLIVNNNNSAPGSFGKTTQVTVNSQTYDNVTIDNGASYVVPNGFTLSVAASGGFTTGGTTRPSLTTNSGGTFTPPTSTFAFTGIDVTNNGTIALVTNATIGPSSILTENSSTGSFSAGVPNIICANTGTLNMTTTSSFTIGTLTVQSGGNVTHATNTTSLVNDMNIIATTMDVQSGGTVNVDGKGFQSQSGTGGTTNGGGGAAYGGNGSGSGVTYGSVSVPTDLGSGGGNVGFGGSGGGEIKLTVSGTLTVNGSITSKGGNGSGGNVDGSGGSIWLNNIGVLAGSGTVAANGGAGGSGSGGGGRVAVYYTTDSSSVISGNHVNAYGGASGPFAGAGTVYLFHTGVSTNGDMIVDNNNQNGTNTTQVASTSLTFDNITIRNGAKYVVPNLTALAVASAGSLDGTGTLTPTLTVNSGGTLGLPGITATGTLTVTNNGTLNMTGSMDLTSGTFRVTGAVSGGLHQLDVSGGNFINSATTQLFSGSDLIVDNGGTYTQDTTTQLTVTNVIVHSGGTLTSSDNSATRAAIVNIAATTITIDAGGIVTTNALGYDGQQGTGKGTDANTAGGGGHCAVGGNGSTPGAGGSIYDSVSNPDDLGAGGGDDTGTGGQQGGSGGGEIRLSATGTFTLNGTISANGQAGIANEGGGGAGGSIRLDAGTLTGTTGTVTANGGAGSLQSAAANGGGGGGAGYIAVYYASETFSGSYTATGGAKGGIGGTSTATAGGNCTPLITDTAAPTVTGVTASNANGTYATGAVVHVQVDFSENVLVVGTPTIALATGTPASTAVNYVSGTGTSELTFDYTVASGNSSADLDYVATNSLTAGTSIKDAGGNNATLTLASPGAAGSLGANKDIVIDAVQPAVTGVTASNANGTYGAGAVIHVQVDFSKNVNVVGTPTLTLATGSPATTAVNYTSGTGTSVLTFDYTVAAGNVSADLDYVATNSLTAGTSIKDSAGNNAVLTLASPGAAGSLGANKDIVIDGASPIVTGVTASNANGSYGVGQVIHVQVDFSKNVNIVGTPTLALSTGSPSTTIVNLTSGSGTSVLTFDYTVVAGNSSADLDYVATTSLTAGTSIKDGAGNDAALTLATPGAAGSLGANKDIAIVTAATDTTTNKVLLSRLKVSATSSVTVFFALPATVSGILTVTFPSGFTVNSDPTGGASSGCLGTFGHTSSTAFATKTNCSGGIFLGGFSVTNPATPGSYQINWVNDDPGHADVYITDEDQISMTATVDPSITFDVGADAGACDGGWTSTTHAVAFGTVSPSAVSYSGNGGVQHICTKLSTNAPSGAIVTVTNANGASGLKSVSVPGDFIPSASGAMSAGVAKYGLCSTATHGLDATTPVGAAPANGSFSASSCGTATATIVSFTGASQTAWTAAGPVSNGFYQFDLNAEASATTAAHADYADTLTWVATGTF